MSTGTKQLFGHWSPRYLRNRISFWSYYRRFPEVPKLTRQAIAILEDWLKPEDIGIEWGSGRSTSWFASRVGRLTSIEHTRESGASHLRRSATVRIMGDTHLPVAIVAFVPDNGWRQRHSVFY